MLDALVIALESLKPEGSRFPDAVKLHCGILQQYLHVAINLHKYLFDISTVEQIAKMYAGNI